MRNLNKSYIKPDLFKRFTQLISIATLISLHSPNFAFATSGSTSSRSEKSVVHQPSSKSIVDLFKATHLNENSSDNGPFIETFMQSVYASPENIKVDKTSHHLRYASPVSTQIPWFNELIYRPDGLPNFFGLNRWNKPINVTSRLPYAIESLKFDDTYLYVRPPYKNTDDRFENLVKETIGLLKNDIEELTRLPITYISPEKLSSSDLNAIHIVYVDKESENENAPSGWDTRFKKQNSTFFLDRTNSIPFRIAIENALNGRLIFTPNTSYQVDGYILTNAKNNIKGAFCYIWKGHSDLILRALIFECAVRSLGVINLITNSQGLLGEWGELVHHKGQKRLDDIPLILTDVEKRVLRQLYSEQLSSGQFFLDTRKQLEKQLIHRRIE